MQQGISEAGLEQWRGEGGKGKGGSWKILHAKGEMGSSLQ